MRRFSKGEAIRFGWTTVTQNFGLALVAMLIIVIIHGFSAYSRSGIAAVVAFVFTIVVALGAMRMVLRFVDGDRGELVDLFAKIPLVISYVIATLLVGIITIFAFCLLIIPGIYVGIRLQFYGWAIVDKDLGPLAAMQESWEITEGSVWNLFLLGLLFFLIGILGLMAIGLGLLITVPLTLVATGYVYRALERGGVSEDI
jgi:uncharacterized membrane protein